MRKFSLRISEFACKYVANFHLQTNTRGARNVELPIEFIEFDFGQNSKNYIQASSAHMIVIYILYTRLLRKILVEHSPMKVNEYWQKFDASNKSHERNIIHQLLRVVSNQYEYLFFNSELCNKIPIPKSLDTTNQSPFELDGRSIKLQATECINLLRYLFLNSNEWRKSLTEVVAKTLKQFSKDAAKLDHRMLLSILSLLGGHSDIIGFGSK
jgi:hypothetical protein